jgi:hypothetical protein
MPEHVALFFPDDGAKIEVGLVVFGPRPELLCGASHDDRFMREGFSQRCGHEEMSLKSIGFSFCESEQSSCVGIVHE